MPESTATAATLAARDLADDAYILVIEGLSYAWTDDRSGELLGGGASTWMGQSDDELGDTFSTREILPGLILPQSIRDALDPKVGLLQTQSATFTLVDQDDVLASLFATEGKAFDILGESIQAGTANLGTSVNVANGTVNPRGKHIGLERIGSSGERRRYPAIPYDLVGLQHPVNILGNSEEGPRPIPISDDPLDFNGRMVTLWRILRRNMPRPGTFSAWPLWQDQASVTGSLVFCGRLTDRGTIDGGKRWQIKCNGWESMYKRSLNSLSPGWEPISDVNLSLTASQRYLAISLFGMDSTGPQFFDSNGFNADFTLSGNKDTWLGELQAVIIALQAGGGDWGPDGPMDAFNNASVVVLDDGTFKIQVDDVSGDGGIRAEIWMHELVWRAIGYDPELQRRFGVLEDEYSMRFTRFDQGQSIIATTSNNITPGNRYWRLEIDTMAMGVDAVVGGATPTGDGADRNSGNARYYRPINEGEPQILRGPNGTPQTIFLGFDQAFLEGHPAVQFGPNTIGASDVDRSRYFAIAGKIATGSVTANGQVLTPEGQVLDYNDVEADDYAQIVRASWVEADYGNLVEQNGRPAMALERYEDPRRFGLNFERLAGEWGALSTVEEDTGLRIAPLLTVGYGTQAALGTAQQCVYQLLLSTGSSGGWSGDDTTDPTFTFGANQHAAQTVTWCGDVLSFDHGLGIPHQLCAAPDDTAPEFDRVPGGRTGALSRVGLAYVGQVDSSEILKALLQTRGLSLSLHGDQLGVTYLAPFSPADAQVTIGEDDLAAHPYDPDELPPDQELRAMGQLDRITVEYGWSPVEGKYELKGEYRSRDREAQARRGDLKLDLRADGLVPDEWRAPGVSPWQQQFRELWEVLRAEFFARRHFLVKDLKLKRSVGRQVNVGTRVVLTNPWPVSPGGGYGITNACGVVIGREQFTHGHYSVDVLVFAGQFDNLKVFGPIARISSTSGADLTCETDHYGVNDGMTDAERFDPSWRDTLALPRVRILSYDRKTWRLSSAYTVSSVTGDVVTLTATPSAADVYRDRDKWLILAEHSDQVGRWPETYGSVIVLDDLQGGSKLES